MKKQLLLLPVLLFSTACSSVPYFGSNDEECVECAGCADCSDSVDSASAEQSFTIGELFSDMDSAPPALLDVPNFAVLSGKVGGGGKVTPELVTSLPGLGYTTIINLQHPQEPGVKEEIAAAQAAGLTYVSVPVGGGDFTLADAHAVAKAIDAAPGKVLFHCRSGGRVSAVWALTRAINEGLTAEEAMQVAANEGCRPIPDSMIQRVGAQLPGR
jgi:uncharacterized protein (TIGR01244 family)